MKSFILVSLLMFMSLCVTKTVFAASPEAVLHFTQNVDAKITWEQGPIQSTESIFSLRFVDATTQEPVEIAAQLKVSLMMPMMGHGSSPTKITAMTDAQGQPVKGAYRVTRCFFTMGGEWDVNVALKKDNGEMETQTLSLNL